MDGEAGHAGSLPARMISRCCMIMQDGKMEGVQVLRKNMKIMSSVQTRKRLLIVQTPSIDSPYAGPQEPSFRVARLVTRDGPALPLIDPFSETTVIF